MMMENFARYKTCYKCINLFISWLEEQEIKFSFFHILGLDCRWRYKRKPTTMCTTRISFPYIRCVSSILSKRWLYICKVMHPSISKWGHDYHVQSCFKHTSMKSIMSNIGSLAKVEKRDYSFCYNMYIVKCT